MAAREMIAERRFEALLARAERLSGRLGLDELRELAHLYRLASARLAVMRSRGSRDPDAVRYLNALCVRGYTILKVPPRPQRRARNFLVADLPAALAVTGWLQAIAALIMLGGAIAGASLASGNPGVIYAMVPRQMHSPSDLQRLMTSEQDRAKFLEHSTLDFGTKSVFSAGLFVHNTQLGLLCFATGILAGVPTLLLLFYNGLTLGAFAWIFSRDPLWPMFWAWLLPHAIPELLGVTLCSAGGLLLGRAVVAPGRDGVGASLRAASQPAFQMVLASVPLFLAAAGIESFLRQSALSTTSRFAAASLAVALVVGYAGYVRMLAARRRAPDLGWLVTDNRPRASRDIDSAPAP